MAKKKQQKSDDTPKDVSPEEERVEVENVTEPDAGAGNENISVDDQEVKPHVGHPEAPAEPVQKTPPADHVHYAARPALKLYKRIAMAFVALVVIVLGVVLYASLVEATIRIDPVEEVVKTEFLIDVVKTPTEESEVRGRVVSGTINRTQTFEPSGEGQQEVEGTARGTVTIFNDSGSSQPLIRTTRLLTPDGVLFRIDEDVTVPANGSVDVEAYADQPGGQGDIGPTEFTIPGLAASRQAEVYAENTEAFTGGLQTVAVLSQEDIDRASNELREILETDAKQLLQDRVGDVFEGQSFETQVIQEEIGEEAGQEVDTFDVSMTVHVVGVFFDSDVVRELAELRLHNQLDQGREFIDINMDGLQVEVEKVDVQEETANLRVYLDGRAITSSTADALQPNRFTGKSREEVRQILVSEGVAERVEVDITPSWFNSLPRLEDHIYIEIQ